MNVLIIGPDPDIPYRNGGVAKFVLYLRPLRECRKLNISFCYLDWSKKPNWAIPAGIRKILGVIQTCLYILRIKRNDTCVHLHVSLYNSGSLKNALLIVLCRLKGFPVFIQMHGGRFNNLSGFSTKVWNFNFAHAAKIGLFPGPQYEELKALFSGKLVRLANFVPHRKSPIIKVRYTTPHFLFLGRVVKEKGIFLLINAFLKLRRQGIKAFLTISGNGKGLEKVKKLISNSGFSSDIELTGYITGKELQAVLNNNNIFVLPSFHEGFPLSFLECSLRGMAPLITTNNGIPYFFEENFEYLPVNLNKKGNLFNKMKQVAESYELRKKIGSNAQIKVESNFTDQNYLPNFIEIYQEISWAS